MKKNLAKKVTLSILASAVLMSSGVVWAAENISVDGQVYWDYTTGVGYVRNATNNPNGNIPDAITSIDEQLNGAYNASGDISDGKVTIDNNVTVKKAIYGGISKGGDVERNIVTIDAGSFHGHIFGGYLNTNSVDNLKVNKNIVIINGGTFYTPGTLGTIIAGGHDIQNSGGNLAEANNNKVIIKDFSMGTSEFAGQNTYTGIQYIAGGVAYDSGKANYNNVMISGGSFQKVWSYARIVGGWGEIESTNNTVTIIGNTNINSDFYIIGGEVGTDGIANNNTINIGGNAKLDSVTLYGGVKGTANSSDFTAKYGGASNPNILNIGVDDELKSQLALKDINVNVGAWSNKKVKSIAGFDKINFNYINWEKNGTVVEVTDSISLAAKDSNGAGGTAVTVGTVNVKTGGITADDKMHLLALTKDGATISGDIDENGSSKEVTVNINEGVAKTYTDVDCDIEKTNTTIDLIIKETLSVVQNENQGGTTPGNPNPNPNPGGGTTGGESDGETQQPSRNNQVLVIGESRAAAVAFTNQGSELIELGLNALARDNSKDTKVFAAVYGNHSEYETGSHVNVNGWSGIVGIGKTNDNGLTVGAFFENGEGNYSTHNIFTADYIRGDGEACYNGGGFLVRKDNANGVYAEASLRAGNLQNELRNAVRNGSELTGYDIDTFYYGAHVGVGKVIARGNDGDSIDVYGKFIYTHHDGETFDIGGTATKFDSVESERLRLGFRINEVQTNKLSMYYGAAWEYEFNGDAHDKIASFDLETPSLEGSTVIGEIGAHYKASDKWSIDLNGRAYVGQREGFSGSVQANYNF